MQNTISDFLFELKYWEIVLLSVFTAFWLLRVGYDFFIFFKVVYTKQKKNNQLINYFSILITIRNEEENLKNKLPHLLANKYPGFEVIVVDDFSQDNSFTILGLMKEKHQNLRISSLNQETRFSSKLAQNIAIKAARNEWIMVVRPSLERPDDSWLESFNQLIDDQYNLVIGYSNVLNEKGFFNTLYRIELFFQQLNSFAYLKMGAGYITNEDNVAFRKQKYFDVGGFASEMNEKYANMELIINKFLKKKTTALLLTPESIIHEELPIGKEEYKELLIKSWRLKSKLKRGKKYLINFNELIRFLFLPLLVIIFLTFPELLLPLAILTAIKVITHIFVVISALNHLTERKLFLSSLLYDLLMPYLKFWLKWVFYHPTRKRKWKT